MASKSIEILFGKCLGWFKNPIRVFIGDMHYFQSQELHNKGNNKHQLSIVNKGRDWSQSPKLESQLLYSLLA